MIDMQRTKEMKPAKTMLGEPEYAEHEEPLYPWGLELRLEAEELKKLGIEENQLPAVGTPMILHAAVRVTAVHVEKMMGGGNETCVKLQIEKMQLGAEMPQDIAERMYGKRG